MRLGDPADGSELSEFAYSGGGRWGSAHGGQSWGRTPGPLAAVTGPQSATHAAHHTTTIANRLENLINYFLNSIFRVL